MTVDILIARFPYGNKEDARGVDWLLHTVIDLKKDKRIGQIRNVRLNDTPITMTRNLACRMAQEARCELLLMLDNDIVPDYEKTKPFMKSTLDFMFAHDGPCVVASPYCGPPPHENIYVFHWITKESDHPNEGDFSLAQYTREEAAIMAGIQEVAALPTGLMLMHTQVLDRLPLPWFEYEYTDDRETMKASTEDVVFTRNCSLAGCPVYCNWDSWAGHVKMKVVGKPKILRADAVSKGLRDSIRRNIVSGESMMEVGQLVAPPKPPHKMIRLKFEKAKKKSSQARNGSTD